MNRKYLLLAATLFSSLTEAQLVKISPGTDLTISGGTIFRIENLTLFPSTNFIITNNTLISSPTTFHSSANPNIFRVYQFQNTTNLFSGTIQFHYIDGAELNNIPENTLTLNLHNGFSWNAFTPSFRDGANNFVLTIGINNTFINELTLADLSNPLRLSTNILGNPVTNNVLLVQVNSPTILILTTLTGEILWRGFENPGLININVSRYPRGVYLLLSNSVPQRVIIQ